MPDTNPKIYDEDIVIDIRVLDKNGNVVDISGATTTQILLKPPTGPWREYTANFVSDGTDGWLRYRTAAGVLDTAGLWSKRARVVLNGNQRRTDPDNFTVDP